MNMQLSRLANVSWLQFADRQALAIRMVSQPSRRQDVRMDRPSGLALERLPALDWPVDLFADEAVEE